jgi:hypothetical protein
MEALPLHGTDHDDYFRDPFYGLMAARYVMHDQRNNETERYVSVLVVESGQAQPYPYMDSAALCVNRET